MLKYMQKGQSLLKEGFLAAKYVSLEEQISRHKQYYYDSLAKSSIGWNEGEVEKNWCREEHQIYREVD